MDMFLVRMTKPDKKGAGNKYIFLNSFSYL